ncbi:MAG: hypothetical protein P8X95_16065 [Anaerolineales bacterium]
MAEDRHFSDLDLLPNPELVAQGADPVRAKESIDLYESLGFEVRAEPVKPSELGDDCTDCQLVVCFSYVTLYTRKK